MNTVNKYISIMGATGNVGRIIIQLLLEKNIAPASQLKLFASSHSAGKQLTVNGHTFTVQNTADYDFKDAKICLFATESDISKEFVPAALAAGCFVVDSSSQYRQDSSVPLVVAPVNKELIDAVGPRLYAVANCLASPSSVVLAPLHQRFGVKRVNVVTYQSVSGAGKAAMDELFQETKSLIEQHSYLRQHFKRQIAFNVIPQVGNILEDGYSQEEIKIIKEIKKIVSADINVTATAVRVPVMIGHSISLSLELNHPFTLDEVRDVLRKSKGITLCQNDYMTPVEVVNSDDVFVGRIRKDPTSVNGLHLWLCSDNLRRGAATDAVEIVEELMGQLKAQ